MPMSDFMLFNLCGDIERFKVDKHITLIRKMVITEDRLLTKYSGFSVVPMTEIPMPDDYSRITQEPPKDQGCCERCCTCWVQLICAIVLIFILIYLIFIAQVFMIF
jgi:hypothetical protein